MALRLFVGTTNSAKIVIVLATVRAFGLNSVNIANAIYEDGHDEEREGTTDVFHILDDGKMELITAYCLGDDECTDYAWTIFAEAVEKTSKPEMTLFWIGKQYADLGGVIDRRPAGTLRSRSGEEHE